MGRQRTAYGSLRARTLISALWLTRIVHGLKIETATTPFSRPPFRQFTSWFPAWALDYEAASTGPCNATLADYNRFYDAPSGTPAAEKLLNACYYHEGCILDHIPTAHEVNLQAASVIGGLMPTLLASIGPSVAEISLLSTHRPLLSFLISLGAPAIWPTRMFEFADPAALLTEAHRLRVAPTARRWAVLLSAAEYAVVAGCAANAVLTGVDIGRKAILSWRCTATFLPLLWSLLASVIHVVAATSFTVPALLGRRRKEKEDRLPSMLDAVSKPALDKTTPHVSKASTLSKRSSLRSHLTRLTQLCTREVTLCANHKFERDRVFQERIPKTTVFMNVTASAMGYVHVTMGILIFSSLQFVGTSDMIKFILLRYIASSVFARLVLVFELAGLRNIAKDEAQEA